MSTRRTPEQVHEQDGHPELVASCSLCHPEPVGKTMLGVVEEREAAPDEGPLPDADPVGYIADSVPLDATPQRRSRPGECTTPDCRGEGTHGGRCHDCHTRPRQGETDS